MNKGLILELADRVEKLDNDFNMAYYRDDYGSPSCLAGWAVFYFGDWEVFGPPARCPVLEHRKIHRKAKDVLDISDSDARELFIPTRKDGEIRHEDITPRFAARVLRRFADTGDINWRVSAKAEKRKEK